MDRKTKLILATLSILALTIGTDFTGALMLATSIEQDFAVDVRTTQWVLNAYALTFAMGMVAGGRLGDMFGRRRLLMIGLVIFTVASIACVLTPAMWALIAARALQGIGSALIWPNILGSAANSVREDQTGFAIGLIIGSVAMGNVLGPLIAGPAAGIGEWRLFFVINFVLGALAMVMVYRLLPRDTKDKCDERIDYIGNVVFASALLALLYALDVGADWGWTSVGTIGLVALSILLLAIFPLLERIARDPLVPPPMLRNGQFMLALSCNGLIVPTFFLLFLYLPQFLHKVLGWSVLAAPFGTLPLMVCLSSMSLLSGRLYNRLGPKKLISFGYGLALLGSIMVLFVTPSSGYVSLVPPMLLIGIGGGLAIGPSGSAAVSAADPSRAGLAGALSFMFHLTLGAIGVAAGTALLAAFSGKNLAAGAQALKVDLSASDLAVLNGSAAGSEASQAILNRLSPEASQQVTEHIQAAFTVGLHSAYWLAIVFAALGLAAGLLLDEKKLVAVDQ